MIRTCVILPSTGCRRWQVELVARLAEAGHAVSVKHGAATTPGPGGPRAVLALEAFRFGSSLASPCPPLPVADHGPADLVIDLTSGPATYGAPTLTLTFCGRDSFPAGLAQTVADGGRADLAVSIDGAVVARGRPMIQDRLWLTRASDNLLAGAISLIMQAVARFAVGEKPAATATPLAAADRSSFAWRYPLFLGKGVAERAAEKLAHRPFYWQVAYRRIDGPGIAETGRLDGPEFTVLPDDGQRFYADPFVFEHDGRVYLFVEEFPYASGRGIISASELREDGMFATPQPVLEEPHHLSYPQVFARDGEIYMIPESASARELVLYRAEQFPGRWVRDTVLMRDIEINDATLFEAGESLWLISTQRFGYGSASDTMVAYSAPALRGPWKPHALNPIAVDHSAARPGGAFIRQDGRVLLPVQDGSQTYGGGLGLIQLERLDHGDISFSPPRPILPGPAWNRKGIHTLNRAGRVEVIDSCG
ncbi:hypothetical protein M1D80_07005 (plasmid) [Phyllobacteriaceae bacterium JZ32]